MSACARTSVRAILPRGGLVGVGWWGLMAPIQSLAGDTNELECLKKPDPPALGPPPPEAPPPCTLIQVQTGVKIHI